MRSAARLFSILTATCLLWLAAPAHALLPPGYDAAVRPSPLTKVNVTLFFNDISSVVEKEQAFEADLYLIARWKDERLAAPSNDQASIALNDVWNPHLLVLNQRNVQASLERDVTVFPDGTVEQRQRIFGTFSVPMNFSEFPHDAQRLFVTVVAIGQATTDVALEFDPEANQAREKPSLQGWSLSPLHTDVHTFAPAGRNIPGLTTSIVVKRLPRYFFYQFMLPLTLIVAMAWSAFWISVDLFQPRQGVAITSMLTIIAYRFSLAGHLPEISYLTHFDAFLLGCTFLVFLTICEVTIVHYLIHVKLRAAAHRFDVAWRIAFPIAFVALWRFT